VIDGASPIASRIASPRAILALLTALNLLNYVDRYVLSAVLPLLQDELHLSNTVAGAFGTVFLIGYFTTSPLFGRLADRTDLPGTRKRLLAAGVAIWSAATFASGLARGPWSLASARAVVGVGEASYATIAPTIIDDMAPPEKKGRWLSIFYIAIPVGSALGFVVGGLLGKIGWRETFWIVGGPGIVAAAACLFIAEPVRGAAREPANVLDSIATLSAIPLYRRGVLGYAAQTFAIGGFGYWAPKFLAEVYGLPVSKGATFFGALLVVAGGIGTWLGGVWADRWATRAARSIEGTSIASPALAARIDLRVCAITGAIAAPFAFAAFFAPSAKVFFILTFGCEVAAFASASPVNAALLRAVPTELRASAMALSIFAIHFLGDLWSPLVLGALRDAFSARVAMLGVPISLALSAGLWIPPRTSVPASASGRKEEVSERTRQ
jgi:MFS transporter, Spinster family, sphingosine-1-phosphate transporter